MTRATCAGKIWRSARACDTEVSATASKPSPLSSLRLSPDRADLIPLESFLPSLCHIQALLHEPQVPERQLVTLVDVVAWRSVRREPRSRGFVKRVVVNARRGVRSLCPGVAQTFSKTSGHD